MKGIIIYIIFVMSLPYGSFAQQNGCDYKVEIITNNTEFRKEEFFWRMKAIKLFGKSTNITGIAEIVDSKGNIIKKYSPWTNESISKQKTSNEFSTNLKENEEYKIAAEIKVECNDENKDNNVNVKIIKKLQTTAAIVQSQQIVYKSSNEKVKDSILIFLLGFSILLNVILIWKR